VPREMPKINADSAQSKFASPTLGHSLTTLKRFGTTDSKLSMGATSAEQALFRKLRSTHISPTHILTCLVQLKMSVNRLRLMQQKQSALAKQARRELAKLLDEGKEESAKIRVENIIREDLFVEMLEILELYCELLLARFGLLEQMYNPALVTEVDVVGRNVTLGWKRLLKLLSLLLLVQSQRNFKRYCLEIVAVG
jgi:hypothetical protein